MSIAIMSRVWAQSPHKGSELLLLLAIADNANEDGVAWPSQETLAGKTRLSVRQIRRLTDALIESGAVSVEDRRNGSTTRRIYRFPSPGQDVLPNDGSPGHSGPVEADIAVSSEPSVEPSQEPQPLSADVETVISAWRHYSPPLIAHRASYLSDSKTVAAIQRALRVYPATEIYNAIFNYATVLGGNDWRWDYRWTISDFLKRGLDRFVDEALPLENFRVRRERFGQRDVGAREFEEAALRLEAEQADERRALEPG